MIGQLPKSLNIRGNNYDIRTDYRTILLIFEAYGDPDLTLQEKTVVMLQCLYDKFEAIPESDYEEAIDKAVWFMDGGKDLDDIKDTKKVIDWAHDEQLIFPAVNKVAGYETRSAEYLHWWTFLGFFNEIGEGLFSTVISIRQKKNKGKKLERYEQDFYRENKKLIDLAVKYTKEEHEEIDHWNELLK
jgi:hypothetical protein